MKTKVGGILSRTSLIEEGWQHMYNIAENIPELTEELLGKGVDRLLVRKTKKDGEVGIELSYQHEEYDLNLQWWERGKKHLR